MMAFQEEMLWLQSVDRLLNGCDGCDPEQDDPDYDSDWVPGEDDSDWADWTEPAIPKWVQFWTWLRSP